MFHAWYTAVRSLSHRRALALMVAFTLALGIGANSAIFSAVDVVLLKPLPYPAADRLVAVYEQNAALRQATQLVAPGRLEEWNAQNHTFTALGASYFENVTDTSGPLPERVAAMNTSPRFFQVLGVAPALGRLPAPEEEHFGGPPIVVVSHTFWLRRLGGDPSVIGTALTLGGARRPIIGVMPPSFRYPTATTDVWMPTRAPTSFLNVRTARLYTTIGRLKPGVTLAQARDDLNAIQARLGEQFPSTDKGWGAALVPLKVQVDARLVLFTFAVGVTTTLLFALAPALEAARRDPADALARGGRAHVGGRHLLQRLLVGTQVALAIVLLTGAGLLIRSFARTHDVSLGLDARDVLTFRMSAQWSERFDAVVQRQARTIARLNAIPGVEAAAFSQLVPGGIDVPPSEFHIVGRDASEKTFAIGRSVSSGYFRALHIPVLRGDTCANDPAAPPFSATLVTQAFSDRYFPSEDPIGHAFLSPGQPNRVAKIVGVVGDVREGGLLKAPEPLIYWCGYNPYWPDQRFLVRTSSSRPVSMVAVRAALREIEPQRAVYAEQPLTDLLSASLSQQRLNTILLALFAATALMLAALGLYGVLSQLVSARRRGSASAWRSARARCRSCRQSSGRRRRSPGGMAAGLGAAFVLAQFMATLVFGISTRDPLTFVLVPVVLALVAALAAIVPARRAGRVDPMEVLRD